MLDCFASPRNDGRSLLPHTLRSYPLKVPLRSLKRSSGCGARTVGVCVNAVVAAALEVAGATDVAVALEVAGATEVSDEELPHNSLTTGEIGSDRSPA